MMGLDRRLVVGLLGAAMQVGAAAAWAQAPAPPASVDSSGVQRRPEELQSDAMKAFDISGDGLLDEAEAKSAGAARYDGLNPDMDDRLDAKEAASVLGGDALRQADTDGDGQLNKAEYLGLVGRKHGEADADKDGKLNRSELDGPAGQALLRLLR